MSSLLTSILNPQKWPSHPLHFFHRRLPPAMNGDVATCKFFVMNSRDSAFSGCFFRSFLSCDCCAHGISAACARMCLYSVRATRRALAGWEGLEKRCCECYAVVKKKYGRLRPRTVAHSGEGIAEVYLWKIMIRPRIVTALMSQGADLCHGCRVFDSTMAMSFFSSFGM